MGTKTRIAQIAPLTEAVPPKLYAGNVRVVSWLTEALVEQGHEVTLFASADSLVTSTKHEFIWPRALRSDGNIRDQNAPHAVILEPAVLRDRNSEVPTPVWLWISRRLPVRRILMAAPSNKPLEALSCPSRWSAASRGALVAYSH